MAYSDRELLARLIECEAGGEYARVGQGSIRKIIMQPGQFVCASETEGGPTIRRTSTICARRTSTTPSRIGRWRATV